MGNSEATRLTLGGSGLRAASQLADPSLGTET